MTETLEQYARRLAAGSEVLEAAAAVRRDGGVALALGDTPLRQLFKPEVAQLEALGNTAEDWSRVRVAAGFNPRRVRACEFRGDVVLGQFNQRVELADGVAVIAGVSNSTVADCVIGHDALVRDVRLLANYVVGPGAVVVDCGRVICSLGATFGNGNRIPVALEGGGRDVEVFAEMDVELAALAARPGPRRGELDAYRLFAGEYRGRVTADRGVIGAAARVWSVPRLEDTYVGPAARVEGAVGVYRSTLLSTPDEPCLVESGALVSDSLLQWGARVSGAAVVERSVLVEQSRVGRQGKVQNSVLGPNTEVAAGEVSSCVLGPFVGCHHQSLLISTLWPAGRGNVGYGANVGSNHTSRAPDQEFWAGEGMFLGLGVSVQFPCDFSRAPYTVIAFGADLSPQKVTFPFSLINAPQEHFPGVPPKFNQIVPAWMLRENIYALKRCEAKFKARDRATRTRIDYAVFRRDTVELMRSAAARLAGVKTPKPYYTEADIPGVGKNVLTDKDRVQAIEAYRFYTCYFALTGLKDAVAAGAGPTARVLATETDRPAWEYQRRLLAEDFGITDVSAGLALLAGMAMQVAKDTERVREKDDTRGVKVIDDYADVHPPADRDRLVRQAWEEADRIRDEVDRYLRQLPAPAGGAAVTFAGLGLAKHAAV